MFVLCTLSVNFVPRDNLEADNKDRGDCNEDVGNVRHRLRETGGCGCPLVGTSGRVRRSQNQTPTSDLVVPPPHLLLGQPAALLVANTRPATFTRESQLVNKTQLGNVGT